MGEKKLNENNTRWSPAVLNNFVQSFIYTQLDSQTVLFLTIQFNTSLLFAHNLKVKQFYLTHRWDSIRYNHSGSEETWA